MLKTAHDLLALLKYTTPLLINLTEPEVSIRPAPNKWSKKEIIGHLIDSACNNQQKFVRTLNSTSGHLDFVGYAQDNWVSIQNYQESDWIQLIDLWSAYNVHIAHIMANAPVLKLKNTMTIEGVGPFTLDFIMPDYLEHLKHHLRAILPNAEIESTFSNVYNA